MRFHVDGSQPEKDMIFVFGSNLKGIHGAGAALAARRYYGAVLGVPEGFRGMSYALPAKVTPYIFMNLETLDKHVKNFVSFAKQHNQFSYFIVRVGCVLGGFKDQDVASLFKKHLEAFQVDTQNMSFPNEWKPYLNPRREP
jgi:hypothetical protein